MPGNVLLHSRDALHFDLSFRHVLVQEADDANCQGSTCCRSRFSHCVEVWGSFLVCILETLFRSTTRFVWRILSICAPNSIRTRNFLQWNAKCCELSDAISAFRCLTLSFVATLALWNRLTCARWPWLDSSWKFLRITLITLRNRLQSWPPLAWFSVSKSLRQLTMIG